MPAWGLAKARRAAGLGRASKFLLMGGFFLLLQLVYFPITQALIRQEVAQAQAFVETLIPRLEVYKTRQGVYPGSIEAILTDDVTPPALLQGDDPLLFFNNRNFYFQRGSTYGFRFYLPDGFIGYSYEYCCGPQGRWTVTD